MHGLSTIQAVFEQAKAANRAAFIPYYPVGYPDYATSVDILQALAEAGSDIIEVGVPFSDPLADGPTIQAATQQALEKGTTPRHCVEAIAELRRRGIETPMVLMGYLNPFIAYGFNQLAIESQQIGIDGFIVPDMPADEGEGFQSVLEKADLALPHFLAPTSSPSRIRLAAQKARGYIYLVSVTGVTGARTTVPDHLRKNIAEIRTVAQQPIAVGFGISTPAQAASIGEIADGIIVGSALVKAGAEGPQAVYNLAHSLRHALD